MKRILQIFALLAVVTGLALLAYASKEGYYSLNPEKRQVFEIFRYMDKGNRPGSGVLVIKDGKVELAKTWGNAILEHEIPLTTSSVLEMGSMSKQFTAFAVAKLVVEGKFSLDDPVRKFVPELPDWGDDVTIGHLAFHTSGIRDWVGTMPIAGWSPEDVMTQDQLNQIAFNQEAPVSPPGQRYDYSNTGWTVLGLAIERVTGQTLREYLAENLFQPLGTTGSLIHDDYAEVIPNRAEAYGSASGGFRHITDNLMAVGSSSVRTTVDDLAKWYLNLETREVGGDEVIDVMLHSKSVLNDGTVHFKRIGFDEGTYRGRPAYTHAGIWAGFTSAFLLLPEDRLYIAVVSNINGAPSGCQMRQVADIYLEDMLGPVEPRTGQEFTRWEEDIPPSVLDDYVGFYRMGRTDYIRVYLEGDSLMAKRTATEPFEMMPTGEDEFWHEEGRDLFRFRRDDQGYVDRITRGSYNRNPCPAPEGVALSFVRPADYVPNTNTNPPASNRREYLPPPTAEELAEFEGEYISDEVQTSYTATVEGDQLILKHHRHGRMPLEFAYVDEFRGPNFFTRTVMFRRNGSGDISSFVLDLGARTRNLIFKKRLESVPITYVPQG